MKNWKTTLVGALAAAVSAIAIFQQNGGELDDWKVWIIPALVAAMGVLSKDFNSEPHA